MKEPAKKGDENYCLQENIKVIGQTNALLAKKKIGLQPHIWKVQRKFGKQGLFSQIFSPMCSHCRLVCACVCMSVRAMVRVYARWFKWFPLTAYIFLLVGCIVVPYMSKENYALVLQGQILPQKKLIPTCSWQSTIGDELNWTFYSEN